MTTILYIRTSFLQCQHVYVRVKVYFDIILLIHLKESTDFLLCTNNMIHFSANNLFEVIICHQRKRQHINNSGACANITLFTQIVNKYDA